MKIGFFITARLKSTRLKRKILLDMNGKTVLERIIDRAKQVKGIEGIVLCTSTNSQDAELYNYALKNKIQFYPGSEDDVLERLLYAAKYYGYDAFVSITADNPLFSIYISNFLINLYKKNQYDFINTKNLPVGCGTYLLDVGALEVVNFMKQQSDTEIWGPFINRPDFFNVANLVIDNSYFNETIRITLDFPEDYEFIKSIYKQFGINETPTLVDVFKLLKSKPSLLKINKMHIQIMPTDKQMKQIEDEFNANKINAIKFAESIGKNLSANYTSYNASLDYEK